MSGDERAPANDERAESAAARRRLLLRRPEREAAAHRVLSRRAVLERTHREWSPDTRAERRYERVVALLFIISTLATIGFLADYYAGDPHKQYYTPVLGVTLAAAFGGIGAGLIVWAKQLMAEEEVVQERESLQPPPAERAAAEADIAAGVQDTGMLTRPLLRRTLFGALGVVSIAPIGLLYSLGPNPRGARELRQSHWSKGVRLVDRNKNPIRLDTLDIGGFITVYPETIVSETGPDIDKSADSVALLIRLRPGEDHPRPGRENWGVEGYVCYSKICTHAGCPVALFQHRTNVLLCPCHQSQFKVTEHCEPIFGPAPRPLPQLAIELDSAGFFVSKYADFSDPVGPSFWERN